MLYWNTPEQKSPEQKTPEQEKNQIINKSKKQAIELGIFDILKNIASHNNEIGDDENSDDDVVWEGCRIRFQKNPENLSKFNIGTTGLTKSHEKLETSIETSDGIILYKALDEGREVLSFRFGPWVERIKKFSEKLTQEKHEKEVIPFSKIDF